MINIIFQFCNCRVYLNFILPFIFSPFLLKFKFRTRVLHQIVDEINLNFIDIEHGWLISRSRVVSEIAKDDSVVRWGDFEACLDGCWALSLQRDWNRLLHHLQVSLGHQLKVDVWKCSRGSIHQDNLQNDIIVMHFNKCFGVDFIGESGKLIYFWINVFLDVAQEVIIALSVTSQSIRDLFRDVEVSDRWASFELSKLNCFIRLSDYNLIFLLLLLVFEQSWVAFKEFLEYSLSLLWQNLLNTWERRQ